MLIAFVDAKSLLDPGSRPLELLHEHELIKEISCIHGLLGSMYREKIYLEPCSEGVLSWHLTEFQNQGTVDGDGCMFYVHSLVGTIVYF